MMPHTPFSKAVATTLLCCAFLVVQATGLINSEAAGVVRIDPGKSAGARGRQLATLQSYLLPEAVTVGLDPEDASDWKAASIERGLRVWSDALPDSPFVLAQPGQKPMIVIHFVDSINSDGDIQGQVETRRVLHWGTSVSYQIEGNVQVRKRAGRHELQEDELTEVIAHELGHVLGLDDAQGCVGLMGPFVPGHARLKPSTEEVGAVMTFRSQLRDAITRLKTP
jgi:hypothetical protein